MTLVTSIAPFVLILTITGCTEPKKECSVGNKKLSTFIQMALKNLPKGFSDRLRKEKYHNTGQLDKNTENEHLRQDIKVKLTQIKQIILMSQLE